MTLKTNAFGKYCRILRLHKYEKQRDMARRLGVSAAYLSSVELGKKAIPANFEKKISVEYELDAHNQKLLHDAINQSRKYIKIETLCLTEHQIRIASQFSEMLKDLNKETLDKIAGFLDENNLT